MTTRLLMLAVMFQFGSVPDNYEEVYLAMARRGARVLALGYKDIGTLSHQQVSGCLIGEDSAIVVSSLAWAQFSIGS